MGRPKGSINKKIKPIQLDFENKLYDEEQSEVCMTNEAVLEDLNVEIDQQRLELEKVRREIEAKKQELATMPLVPVIKDAPAVAKPDQSLMEKVAAQKAFDSQLVQGKFYNLRAKGQYKKLPYHKYADDPIKWWHFEHGGTYTIPRGFADQINEYYYTPRFIQKEGAAAVITNPDDPGSGLSGIDTSDKMYSFVPLNF